MNFSSAWWVSLILILCLLAKGCEEKPSSSNLQGQTNASLRFYGLAVDQDGRPLAGARIEYQVDAYPKDWTFETRGRPYETTFVSATSGADGKFEFDVVGCIMRLKTSSIADYEPLQDSYHSENFPNTLGIRLIAWSEQQYRSDPMLPAIFVFVKNGSKEVSVLPSVGGWQFWEKKWRAYKPIWPRKPTLPDVIYVGPTTRNVE